MQSKIADLHIHSFYSDGTMSPEEILSEALAKGVGLLAISDHDILQGTLKLQKLCSEKDIKYISAVELDSLDQERDVHILGYGINLQDEEFCAFVKRNRDLLDEISIKLINKMQDEIEGITLTDFNSFNYDKKKGGWKALHYFMEKGLTKSLREGFTIYQKYDFPYDCVEFPSVGSVVQYIHNAGGKAILAHPGEVLKGIEIVEFKKEVTRLVDLGLDGIECYYPTHSAVITDICLELCKDRNLLITAGSDCHGEFGSTRIGEMNIPIEWLNLGEL